MVVAVKDRAPRSILQLPGEVVVLGRPDVADERLGALLPARPRWLVEQVLDQLVVQQMPGPQRGDEVELVDVVAQLDSGLLVVEVVGDHAVPDESADVAVVL